MDVRMERHDWKAFCELMDATAEYYRAEPLTLRAKKLAFDVLSDLSFGAVHYAVSLHVSGASGGASRFCPSAADLRMLLAGLPEEQAAEAWACVMAAIRRFHARSSVRFSHPAFHYAIQACGGWPGLCSMPVERGERMFTRYFVIAVRRNVRWEDVPAHMPGDREMCGSVLRPWRADEVVDVHFSPCGAGGGALLAEGGRRDG